MAIEILKQERTRLRAKARIYNRCRKEGVGVRAHNALLKCAKLTVAIIALQHAGL